ncbi:MAG TPA: DUF6282 family protein [Candidatus Binatia bacterium]|nr:DUF6282 family protein [Candidatus Binatia bacterium]
MSAVPDGLLTGAVDLHYHSAPSPFPRKLDPAEAARHYDAAGFRAVVLKSHHHNTQMDVLTIKSTVLDGLRLQVFGGIALNGTVGGLNPRAVELSLRMGGKIVWFPTMSSHPHIEHHAQATAGGFPTSTLKLMPEEPISVLDEKGELKPEVHEIIELIREEDAILASGHLSPPEIFAVFEAAKAGGVEKLVVQHPDFVIGLSEDEARRLAAMGAYIEHSVGMYYNGRPGYAMANLERWIEVVGPERTTLGSDVGQATSPSPAEAFGRVAGQLVQDGLHEKDVRQMMGSNPAQLLGL